MIHVAVLAGGQSRRMGRDKALLPLGDQTLIERVIAATRPLGYPCFIVGDPATYTHLGLPVHPDRHPGLGPLGGLHTALGADCRARTPPRLRLALSHPGLPPTTSSTGADRIKRSCPTRPQDCNRSARSMSRPAWRL